MKALTPENFWKYVDRSAGVEACWPWIAKSRTANGYGVTWWDTDGRYRAQTAHRVAFFLCHGRPAPRGLDVMHACDNRLCCSPAHLSVGTRQENVNDMMRKGRYPRRNWARGERQGASKLTEPQVRELRSLAASGAQLASLARKFGIHWTTAQKIVVRRSWRHVA